MPVGVRRLVREEDGLVTVEWVALTAGLVIGAMAVGYIVMNNTANTSGTVATGICGGGGSAASVTTNGFGASGIGKGVAPC